MFARILAGEGKELELFQAALEVLPDLQSQWELACEFIPGLGVNLYQRRDMPDWAASLGKVAGDAAWELLRAAGFPRSPEDSREEGTEDDNVPVVVFASNGEVYFRHPYRISRATLFLTGCALKILKRTGTAESIQVVTDDWPTEDPDELVYPEQMS